MGVERERRLRGYSAAMRNCRYFWPGKRSTVTDGTCMYHNVTALLASPRIRLCASKDRITQTSLLAQRSLSPSSSPSDTSYRIFARAFLTVLNKVLILGLTVYSCTVGGAASNYIRQSHPGTPCRYSTAVHSNKLSLYGKSDFSSLSFWCLQHGSDLM
ncbi:hypothetical protein EDD16DRAFT_985640 [Pisolithus croceorrhizus]|nr:hypothetical protein EDD16DRAFT_985640 [Pisolithus croceorrhizus]KAI6158986.1 hypothetical protein EDD17DRAFT_1616651 [Pisolithus thermaeus]